MKFYILLLAQVFALLEEGSQPIMATYWGANLLHTSSVFPSRLVDICRNQPFIKIISLYKVNSHFSTAGMPGVTLHHCTEEYSGYPGLLNCPQIAEDILECQSLGVKVLITIANDQNVLKSEKDGEKAAVAIWDAFFKGIGPHVFRGAVLDGIDLMVRDGVKGYSSYVRKLRSLMNADASKEYIIAASPRCTFPDANIGPLYPDLPLTNDSKLFDYINIHAMSSPDCSYFRSEWFWKSFSKWNNWAKTVNLPVLLTLPSQEGVSAPGDYIDINTMMNDRVINDLIEYHSKFKGINLFDISADFDNRPCKENTQRYSEIVHDFLQGDSKNFQCSKPTTLVLDSDRLDPNTFRPLFADENSSQAFGPNLLMILIFGIFAVLVFV